jgi:Bacterial hydrolase
MTENKDTHECCPEFNPEPWDYTTHNWVDKPFVKDSVRQCFHRPLPWQMKKVISRMWRKVRDAGAAPEMKDFLMLAYDPSPWKSELYLTVTKEVPGAENVRLTGTFISKVFDGPFSHIPKYLNEFRRYLVLKELTAKKYYFYYTYCPKCAKKYGHNYIVAFAEI